MGIYRKKPVEIEAFDLAKPEEYAMARKYIKTEEKGRQYIETLEGRVYDFRHDDFLIIGVKGEPYPCKRDIFFATYEKLS